MQKKQETRSIRVSGRIKPFLAKMVEDLAEKQNWSFSDCIETGLARLVKQYQKK